MQQHHFAQQYRWEEVSQRLLPMIEQCQQFLAEADAALPPQASSASGAANVAGRMADMATGQFSWRMPPDGTGGSVMQSRLSPRTVYVACMHSLLKQPRLLSLMLFV